MANISLPIERVEDKVDRKSSGHCNNNNPNRNLIARNNTSGIVAGFRAKVMAFKIL